MAMCFSVFGEKKKTIYVSNKVFPQSLAVIKTRAKPLGIKVEVGDVRTTSFKDWSDLCGVII